MTTAASRRNPFSLTVALSAGGQAWGDLFWDDGDGLDTFETGNYSYIVFVADEVWNTKQICFRGSFSLSAVFTCCENLLQSQVVSEPMTVNEALTGLELGGLQVFGLPSAPLFVLANGVKVTDFTYCSEMKVSSLWLSTLSIRIIKILYVCSTSFPPPAGFESDQAGFATVRGVDSPVGSLML